MNNSICTLFDNILIDIHKFKSLHKVKSDYPNIYGFLFDEDHIIVRSNETPEAGLYVFSISSDSFVYWPQPVFQ